MEENYFEKFVKENFEPVLGIGLVHKVRIFTVIDFGGKKYRVNMVNEQPVLELMY